MEEEIKTQTLGFYGNAIDHDLIRKELEALDQKNKNRYKGFQVGSGPRDLVDLLEVSPEQRSKDYWFPKSRIRENGGYWEPMGAGGLWRSIRSGYGYAHPGQMEEYERYEGDLVIKLR